MEELKVVFASNLIRLRTQAGMTQLQLAEHLNYSDKSVSKWERGDALPDLMVTKSIADLFGVTVDFLLQSHDQWEPKPVEKKADTRVITAIVQVGIWTVAAILFVIFWLLDQYPWIIFVATTPVSLLTLLILNAVFKRKRYQKLTVSLFVVSVFMLCYSLFWQYHPWQILLLLVPSLILVWLSFHTVKDVKRK